MPNNERDRPRSTNRRIHGCGSCRACCRTAVQHPALGILVAASLWGCGAPARTSDLDIKKVQLHDLKQMLAGEGRAKGKGPTVLVDVRSIAGYEQGHIPGAINIPIAQLKAADPKLGRAHHIVVYAGGWADYLSPAAYKKLVAVGYENVLDFRGGLELWTRSGNRVVEGR